MLVLTRKNDQEVVIDGNIRIRVLKVKGNTVRLGIDAPSDVNIKRGELNKKDSRRGANLPESTDLEANFSIVFDNNGNAETDMPSVISFDRADDINRLKQVVSDGQQIDMPASSAGQCAMEFRGKLPETFHRNRLQEVVSRMAAAKKTTR